MSHLALDPAAEFVRPPQVAGLIHETFSGKEIAAAFKIPHERVIDIATRYNMFLISETRERLRRNFHYLDSLAILVAYSFFKTLSPAGKKTVLSEVSHLLFGQGIALDETGLCRDEARAEGVKALYRQHIARRAELCRHPWRATPLWWSRSADKNFCLFQCRDHRIIAGVFDRRAPNGGAVPLDDLEKLGVVNWVNCTRWFCRADAQLAAILEARRVEA